MMEAVSKMPKPKRFRTRFPLTSFAPIAVEVREVEPLEVVNRRGRKAVNVSPELAERVRKGERGARLELLRAVGRLLLFPLSPVKVYGFPSRDERKRHAEEEIRDSAERWLRAAEKGREELVNELTCAVESRASRAPELTGWPYPAGEEDERRDAEALAGVVLELLNFGAVR